MAEGRHAEDRDAILRAEREWGDAIRAHDIERVVAFFAPTGASMPPDKPMIIGAEGRRAFLETIFAEPEFESTWETERVDVSEAGDMALSLGTTAHRGKAPDGHAIRELGKYVTVWQKIGGRWLVLADIWNSTSTTQEP